MDLVLVMKERLRDQNSETRLVIRTYLQFTLAGAVLLMFSYYCHPHQQLFAHTVRRATDDAASTVNVTPTNSSDLMTSVVLFVLGQVSLIVALRYLANLSRIARTNTWQSPARLAAPTGTPFTSPRVASTTNGVGVGGELMSVLNRYSMEISGVILGVLVARPYVSFGWLVFLQVGQLTLFCNFSYHLIISSAPR